MTLPDDDTIRSLLADFADVQIDSDEWSTNGGAFVNHDWHAVAVRKARNRHWTGALTWKSALLSDKPRIQYVRSVRVSSSTSIRAMIQ